MEKKKTIKMTTTLAIGAAAIFAVAPAQSEAATSLTTQISNAQAAMKQPYDSYFKSTGKLADLNTVVSDIAKAKQAQIDVNAAIKKAKLSSKNKKAKYAKVNAYNKYIERAQGYVDAYQAASKASTTYTNLSGEISKAILIKDVTTIQEQSTALKNAITDTKKEINTVYGAKVKDLLFKTFTTPTEDQVAALTSLNKELFTAVLTQAKTQAALKEILDTAHENAYVAIDVTGATEDLSFNTSKALNITVKGDLGGRNITINTPNSDIVNNATNVGTAIINDVSNNSFHQGSGTVQKVEVNDPNGGHVTNANFTNLYDLDTATDGDLSALNNRINMEINNQVLGNTPELRDKMNRGELARNMALAFNLQIDTNVKTSSFSDVKIDDPNLPYIEATRKAGIIDGNSLITFDPTGSVTNELLTTMFSQQQGVTNKDSDKNSTDWAKGYVALAIQLHLLGNRDEIVNPGAKKPDITLGAGTNVALSGNFGTVTAAGDATVTVHTGTTVSTLVSNGDVTLTAPKGAISEISGSGTVDPTTSSEFNDTDVKNAGGTIAPNQTPATTDTGAAAGSSSSTTDTGAAAGSSSSTPATGAATGSTPTAVQ